MSPLWLQDFVAMNLSNTVLSAFQHVQGTDIITPSTYSQAKDYTHWRTAMDEELEALSRNQTWVITPLPSGKHPIGCKWVYRVKTNSDGSISRYKARLVAKGYNQVEGVDYTEKFAPVAKNTTIRIVLA